MTEIIQVHNISKQYRLGQIGTGTISHDLNRWWNRVRGKDDPFLKIGEENDRSKRGQSQYAWALRDINFDVKQGDVLGIIGLNGAGKSTLLKILSRTTAPTTGEIKIKGRVASLLEVGTGFHPELTGRENIFLNGAILGMARQEIKSKFDEIVDFAGVERYIETPVKRYSSGMYVRLAFSVAAHLEPEILIVDEVLAVGDADFQKKCLGKMKDVSKGGRTVLFVSHNMTAIKNLCDQVIYLNNGKLEQIGPAHSIINSYLSRQVNSSLLKEFKIYDNAPGNNFIKIQRIEVVPKSNSNTELITIETYLDIEFDFLNNIEDGIINLSMGVYTIAEEHICQVVSEVKELSKGLYRGVCKIPGHFLNDGIYKINILVVLDQSKILFEYKDAVSFEVNESRETSGWHGKWPGFVRPDFIFKIEKLI